MNTAWVTFAAFVAFAATSSADVSVGARQYGLPGVSRAEPPQPKGYFAPLPPGARAYFARPDSPRSLFTDPAAAVADLPEGEYKLFYTPPAIPAPPPPEPARSYGLPGARRRL